MSEVIGINREEVAQRKNKLEAAKIALKNHFVGIDNIIDELIDCIQIWYLMPELLTRPVIINLWGMTGVGKTDLIRRLVKCLDYQDRFAEIELSNSEERRWLDSVVAAFEQQELHDSKPCIVLFDEIQRFSTLDADGKPITQTKFADFWELLSDGKLSKKQKDDLDNFLFENALRKKSKMPTIENESEPQTTFQLDFWQAASLKKALNLEVDINAMLDIPEEEMVSLILNAKRKKVIYEPINHAKTLIIISGNLDEAFAMANEAAEADIDADIYHAFTTKVTTMHVKKALSHKFRPEQVARFGNIHLIYPSLSKQNFTMLIEREIERIIADAYARTGIKLHVDKTINRLIYRNGVFPAQGVRPLFSSVSDILETNISKLLFGALDDEVNEVSLAYNEDAAEISTKIGNKVYNYHYVGRIDKIRRDNTIDNVANTSVHEAGHAILYMELFELIPLQLQSNIASSSSSGFTFPHQIHLTRNSILDIIKVYLAGGIAEELVFGRSEASTGRSSDRSQATTYAQDFVRKYGFTDEYQADYSMEEYQSRMKMEVADSQVEELLKNLVAQTTKSLTTNRNLLNDLSKALANNGKLEPPEIKLIADQHGLFAEIKSEGHLHIKNYDAYLS